MLIILTKNDHGYPMINGKLRLKKTVQKFRDILVQSLPVIQKSKKVTPVQFVERSDEIRDQ